MSAKARQQNFRLPDELVERLEAVVPAKGAEFDPVVHRARSKADAVREALELWLEPGAEALLDAAREARFLEMTARQRAEYGAGGEEPRFTAVLNPAEDGTVLRLAEPDGYDEGCLLMAARTGEVMRVRSREGDALYVDRGVGGGASAIQEGDEVLLLGAPVEESSEASPRESAPAAGNGAAPAGDAVGVPGSPPSAPEGGQGAVPAPEPPDSEATVEDLASWLAERLGKPRAVTSRYIAAGRVRLVGATGPVHPDGGGFPSSWLEPGAVELDGEPVA